MKKLIILLTLGFCILLASNNFPVAVIISIAIVAIVTKSKSTTIHYGIMSLCVVANPFYLILFILGEIVRMFSKKIPKQKNLILFTR